MRRADAAAILNVSVNASSEEAVRAYQDLVTESQIRLTNAPTPTLKNWYQARPRELEDAKEAFVGAASGDEMSDLPPTSRRSSNGALGASRPRRLVARNRPNPMGTSARDAKPFCHAPSRNRSNPTKPVPFPA